MLDATQPWTPRYYSPAPRRTSRYINALSVSLATAGLLIVLTTAVVSQKLDGLSDIDLENPNGPSATAAAIAGEAYGTAEPERTLLVTLSAPAYKPIIPETAQSAEVRAQPASAEMNAPGLVSTLDGSLPVDAASTSGDGYAEAAMAPSQTQAPYAGQLDPDAESAVQTLFDPEILPETAP